MLMTMDVDNASFFFCTLKKLVDPSTGPTRGHEPRCASVVGSFNAMKSPAGSHGMKEPASVIHSSTRIQPA